MPITGKKNSKFYSYVIIARNIQHNTWRIDNSITSFPREKTFMREIIYIET